MESHFPFNREQCFLCRGKTYIKIKIHHKIDTLNEITECPICEGKGYLEK